MKLLVIKITYQVLNDTFIELFMVKLDRNYRYFDKIANWHVDNKVLIEDYIKQKISELNLKRLKVIRLVNSDTLHFVNLSIPKMKPIEMKKNIMSKLSNLYGDIGSDSLLWLNKIRNDHFNELYRMIIEEKEIIKMHKDNKRTFFMYELIEEMTSLFKMQENQKYAFIFIDDCFINIYLVTNNNVEDLLRIEAGMNETVFQLMNNLNEYHHLVHLISDYLDNLSERINQIIEYKQIDKILIYLQGSYSSSFKDKLMIQKDPLYRDYQTDLCSVIERLGK